MKAFALIPLISCGLLSACGGGGGSDDTGIESSVNAGTDLQIIEKSEFTITAQGSPADGTFTWQQVSGPSLDGFPLDGAEQTLTAPDVKADSEIILRVSYQSTGSSAVSDDITISVSSNNQLPLVVVTQTLPETLPSVYKDTIILSALESTDPDDNGQIDTYFWEQLSGLDLDITSFDESTLSFSHPLLESNTNLSWKLTITDDEGGQASTQYDMTLNKTNELVDANAGDDQTVEEFELVTLDATGSETVTDTYECTWQQLTGNAETLSSASQCATTFTASDVDTDTTLSFEVTVTDSKGRTDTDSLFVDVTPKALGLINDSGVGECYNNTQRINCASDDFPEQDAELGRDSYANRLDKVGKGNLAFDYTKLNKFADEVADDSSDFTCIRDNVTGLVWEVKSAPSGTVPDTSLRDGQNHYFWDIGETTFTDTSTANSTCPNDTSCGVQSYINEVNDLDFCGGTNWRLPTYTELLGLIDYGKQGQRVLIDESLFPYIPQAGEIEDVDLPYWTSQTAADGTSLSQAYIIDMSSGNDLAYPKENTAYVRLVRSR
ncbi:MAG: PKD domain-containing protein [Pseudoalteromonas sp.]|uniref:Lcl C-terminal domain-containing protein n=1 Tax=Pseudoalteromonas sp. TaxID=53249 RepID=UPI00384DFC08